MNNGGTITVMQEQDRLGREYFRRIDPLRVDNAEDVELAFALQNSGRNDPDLLRRLIERYGGELYRWVAALLYYQYQSEPTPAQILAVLGQVFSHAIDRVDQFHGQASVLTWLFGIANRFTRPLLVSNWIDQSFHQINLSKDGRSNTAADGWQRLEKYTEGLRRPLILRYLFKLTLQDIASILDIQVSQVHHRLVKARKPLLSIEHASDMDRLLQAYQDGLYIDDHAGENQIVQHVAGCEECQSRIQELEELEKSLDYSLNQKWKPMVLDGQQVERIYDYVLSLVQKAALAWQPKIKVGQAAWIIGLSITFVAMAVVFIRLTPNEKEFPQSLITPTAALPPVTKLQPEVMSSPVGNEFYQAPQFVDPAISADGNWAVFSSIRINLATQRLGMPTINLYSRQDNTIKVIGESTSSLQMPWAWPDLAPSISADGQLILYVSSANEHDVPGFACQTRDERHCLDIFLYDQKAGITRRLTQSTGGGPSDGDSLAPAISADGQWVAFWSAADNLVAGDPDVCQPSQTSITCLYIYLYNVSTRHVERLPVRNDLSSDTSGADRISLSADGRFVGFTFTFPGHSGNKPSGSQDTSIIPAMTDSRSNNLESQQSTEAIIYDQQSGKFELENVAPDGKPGNGPSTSPVISADGRYVAFVSASSNLVNSDNNDYYDVFVRDRQTGVVELASVSSDGTLGDNHSGLAVYPTAFYSIDISSDGRYVVFQSLADNLQPKATPACRRQDISSCVSLYYHDRQTGRTVLISAVPDLDYAFFPGISADGRWVIYTGGSYSCRQEQYFCSDVVLYDSQRGWVSKLTNFSKATTTSNWIYSASLLIPWQAWEATALTFSPDGKQLALRGYDSTIRLWQIPAGIKSIDKGTPDTIINAPGNLNLSAFAFSQDSRWLAAGTSQGVVLVYDVQSGSLLYSLDQQTDPVIKVLFSTDSEHLIISTHSDTWIWTLGDRRLLLDATVPYGSPTVYALDVSPQGDLLATVRSDQTVWLQSLPSGEVINRLDSLGLTTRDLAFSSDGALLATHSIEGIIEIWQIRSGSGRRMSVKLLTKIQSRGYIGELYFSPDDKYLASTAQMGQVIMWSVPDGTVSNISSPLTPGTGYAMAFSNQDAALAVVYENEIALWRQPPGYASSYYVRSSSDSFVDSTPQPLATANDIPEFNTPMVAESNLNLDQTSLLMHFPLIVPTRLPESINFLDAAINQDGSVILRYVSYQDMSYQALLYVYEKEIGWFAPPTMTLGTSATILPMQILSEIGNANAEYVQGDWLFSRGFTPPGSDSSLYGTGFEQWAWSNTDGTQRLRWVQNGILVALYYKVNYQVTPPVQSALSNSRNQGSTIFLSSLLGQNDLIQIASGMDWYSQANVGMLYDQMEQTGTSP